MIAVVTWVQLSYLLQFVLERLNIPFYCKQVTESNGLYRVLRHYICYLLVILFWALHMTYNKHLTVTR